ncbi:FkbM family methyltransferase [Flagellimonas alvinocaridis]|uniref:FkbM family methyltransferase n=1 Tax=Flagellimonas alvinocaridis TaxID=2530200 RepID=A0A4S8RN62_9FLAO|nr:FkbM family methyltransferase [Allomuricauda alvinocaridis]THV59520.1 FkbM family methyltransferase [Allomuricauda alvinocaridis]
MGFFHSLVYEPNVNRLLRNVNRILSPLLPEHIKIHPSGSIKVDVGNGIAFRLKTNQTSYITRELFWDKPENFEYTPLFIELVKKVETFWDVGTNIGYYSILGCMVNPKLKVHAFEPSMGPMTYLEENIKINNIADRVKIEPVALSDVNGDIEFYQIHNPKFPDTLNLSGEHNIGTKTQLPSKKVKVRSSRLDDYNQPNKRIDLIKIDTEGAEVHVLKGSQETIKTQQPIIICETLFNGNEGQIEALLKDEDYLFFNHTEKGLEEVPTLVREKDNGVRNCFMVPRSKKDMIMSLIAR